MPCHDILVETSIVKATDEQVERAAPMWKHMVEALDLTIPDRWGVTVSGAGYLMFLSAYGSSSAAYSLANERYAQTYVGRQIFAALEADGYEMEAYVSPDAEGTWVIKARDITRNATIGVTLYRTLEFEIDFLDALHDDSVWLSGGEFGRVIERIKAMGLSADVVKLDVDEEAKRHLRQAGGLLA
jgi:hypothetical protein